MDNSLETPVSSLLFSFHTLLTCMSYLQPKSWPPFSTYHHPKHFHFLYLGFGFHAWHRIFFLVKGCRKKRICHSDEHGLEPGWGCRFARSQPGMEMGALPARWLLLFGVPRKGTKPSAYAMLTMIYEFFLFSSSHHAGDLLQTFCSEWTRLREDGCTYINRMDPANRTRAGQDAQGWFARIMRLS
jgi:hypothetical protein